MMLGLLQSWSANHANEGDANVDFIRNLGLLGEDHSKTMVKENINSMTEYEFLKKVPGSMMSSGEWLTWPQ
jgi:hypothetical protein